MISNESCRSEVGHSPVPYRITKRLLNYSTVDNVEILPKPIHWPPNIILPNTCYKSRKPLFFVVVIHSSIKNFKRRERLRATWTQQMRDQLNFDVIFAIGRSLNVSIQDSLEREADLYGDILQSNALDDYKLLPVKAHSWIQYLKHSCAHRNVSFVLKLDDDVTTNMEEYHNFLLTQRDKQQSVYCLTYKHIADRRVYSKWFLSYSEFPFRNLGIFCAGLAYTITIDLIPQMHENSKYRRFVWLDDFYTTHSLLNDVDFSLYDISDLYLVSEEKRDAYRQLRQILSGERQTPIFSHLRPRSFFTDDQQITLWRRSQACSQRMSATEQYGVSMPISTEPPTEQELKFTDQLNDCLNSFNLFENDEELQKRLEVLRRINALVRTWVRKVSEEKVPAEDLESVGGKLFTFGSYRLGVHTKGADIDSLCVVPRHVDRTEFFKSFYQMLSEDENVTDLHAVEDAFVPLIKLHYRGIDIDILFARLALKSVPDDQELADDNLLRNLDEKSIRSLNGCRVADEILRVIPNRQNFITTLRAVKIWAKNHGIYSNVLGFFGAILLQKFFLVFSTWKWPHPVYLKDNESVARADIPFLRELVWDPRVRISDRYHLMPIITPAFPEQNSTYNVTNSTKMVITYEFKEALAVTIEIMEGKASWSKLFEEVNFFSRYKHFLSLVCITETAEDHLKFSGLVESKIRLLIASLERHEAINAGHINPKHYKPKPDAVIDASYSDPVCTLWFIGLDLDRKLKKSIDLTKEIQAFNDTVISAGCNTGTYKETMLIKPNYIRRSELPNWLTAEELQHGRVQSRKRTSDVLTSSLGTAAKKPCDELTV
ncbi:Poly(A) polymerase and Nucleotidyltransferase domain containing protein [Aphelenchoides bicaudatus]|nr:Poly(A) polymerase and Nucleotidyltransferase domain containing protein [Aphelenchoides bicaudatus]